MQPRHGYNQTSNPIVSWNYVTVWYWFFQNSFGNQSKRLLKRREISIATEENESRYVDCADTVWLFSQIVHKIWLFSQQYNSFPHSSLIFDCQLHINHLIHEWLTTGYYLFGGLWIVLTVFINLSFIQYSDGGRHILIYLKEENYIGKLSFCFKSW